MKRFGFLIILSFFFVSCGQTAIGYNDSVIRPQIEISAYLDSIFLANSSYNAIHSYREEMKVTDNRLKSIIPLWPLTSLLLWKLIVFCINSIRQNGWNLFPKNELNKFEKTFNIFKNWKKIF